MRRSRAHSACHRTSARAAAAHVSAYSGADASALARSLRSVELTRWWPATAAGTGAEALPEYRSQAIKGQKFEYLDHTADVQCHAWGADLPEAFANVGLAMYNYMTPIKGITVDESLSRSFEAEGHDLQSLLFNFMDELLFVFHTEFFVARRLRVTKLDRESWTIEAKAEGGKFSRDLHECGTEVKAITYSAMQILESPTEAEVFVIVDI